MRKKVVTFFTLCLSVFLVSCAAQFPFIASVAQSEMLDLQSLCSQQSVTLPEKTMGDSLAGVGALLLEKKKNQEAYALFDRATTCYRIALTTHAVTKTEEKIALEEQALSRTREDVSAYNHVLKKLKSMEQQ